MSTVVTDALTLVIMLGFGVIIVVGVARLVARMLGLNWPKPRTPKPQDPPTVEIPKPALGRHREDTIPNAYRVTVPVPTAGSRLARR